MSVSVRDGFFDVAILAGPRVSTWPSAGARAISVFCAEMDLTVGVFGGEGTRVRGVLPLPGTGGLCLVEDAQGRLHRISARAVVKFSAPHELCLPFPGWRQASVIPLSTALDMLDRDGRASWAPGVAILGSDNASFRFASTLLESLNPLETPRCYVIEPRPPAKGSLKPYRAWEVEKRRFDMLGGRFLNARPVSLRPAKGVSWELRVEDSEGTRVLEVLRVVSALGTGLSSGVREHPVGSLLFELEQTARSSKFLDFEGWVLEEERGRALAARISRALISELGPRKDSIDQLQRRARSRLKFLLAHQEASFHPSYEGKWLSSLDQSALRNFSGVPQTLYRERLMASIECIEDIACNLCEKACPESAIQFPRGSRRDSQGPILIEADCTACGACLTACPASVPVMIQEKPDSSFAQVTLLWRGVGDWKVGEVAHLVNRRGESVGTGRVVLVAPGGPSQQLVQVQIPSHLLWDARGLRRPKAQAIVGDDPSFIHALERESDSGQRIEIQLNGDRRFVRESGTVLQAFRDLGFLRAQDALNCPDGSCRLCSVEVDGVKQLACQTSLRRGMAIRARESFGGSDREEDSLLCPCMGIKVSDVREVVTNAKLRSADAIVSATGVGAGRCHGELCEGAFREVLGQCGISASEWIDWRFPFMDWTFGAPER